MSDAGGARARAWRPRSAIAGTALAVGALTLGAVSRADAQGTPRPTVVLTPPEGRDTLRSVTPTFLGLVINAGPARPVRVVFQLAATPEFQGRLLLDTTLALTDTSFSVAPPSALPPAARVYWRAFVRDDGGAQNGDVTLGGPRVVPQWVTLVSPTGPSGTVVRNRRPRFVWSAPQINEPPGPWEFDIEIRGVDGRVLTTQRLRDTTFTPARDLEANASYRWQVTARTVRGVQVAAALTTPTFTVEDPAVPTSTLLYQNFPNPFPAPFVANTCFWFDIGPQPSRVQLEIYTLRGVRVRRLLPSATVGELLPPGRYGRQRSEVNEACDTRFEWDGTDDAGRTVPAGVYLARFKADGGYEAFKKILFRGR